MKNRNKAAFLFLTMIAGNVLVINPALAHSFNVALVTPPSNAGSVEGRQIREGFMLATTERDSHPDQESDGHLGGLDVYVTVIDGIGDSVADIGRRVEQGDVDIVAAFGSETTLTRIRKLLDGKLVVLLVPGQTAFLEPDLPLAFMSAYEREYGSKPSSQAAQGYNAARRIDMAVRSQGGVDDTDSMLRSFRDTARGFAW